MVPATLVLAATSIQLSANPTFLFESAATSSGNTSAPIAISAVGGSGSYTYTWTRLSGSTYISANSPSASSTTFAYNFPFDGFFTTVFECEVDDGITSETITVTVSITYTGP